MELRTGPWKLTDLAKVEKNGLKVFSCFACGGGSTMGYKLAGFDVIGCNEIDPKMMACYIENHHPKYSYLESIETLKLRDDLPAVMYDLDILDGSPPCSSFSMMGIREEGWGKKKKFKEGQVKQVLDTLFFDFIDLAEKLQPKVVNAENVEGLILGNAKNYAKRIYKAFDKAGYFVHHTLLDAQVMGVPQRRRRVFFTAIRKDLVKSLRFLDLHFHENKIPFKDFDSGLPGHPLAPSILVYHEVTPKGSSVCNYLRTKGEKEKFWAYRKVNPNQTLRTILSGYDSGEFRHDIPTYLNDVDIINGSTF